MTTACDLFKELTKLNLIYKDSASNSEVLFAKLKNDDVAAKIWFGYALVSNNYDIPAFIYEAKAYEYITKNIYDKGICRNFIYTIGSSLECPYSILQKFHNTLYTRVKRNYSFPIYFGVIFTNRVGIGNEQITLYDFIRTESEDHAEIKQMVFQLLYSLCILEKFKISHNDLHYNNIIIIEYTEPKKCLYKINEKTYTVNTRYIPYIFDWDNSYVTDLGINSSITDNELCPKYLMCNEYNPYYDLYMVFSMMIDSMPNSLQKLFLEKTVKLNDESGSFVNNFFGGLRNIVKNLEKLDFVESKNNQYTSIYTNNLDNDTILKYNLANNSNLKNKSDVIIIDTNLSCITTGFVIDKKQKMNITNVATNIGGDTFKIKTQDLKDYLQPELFSKLYQDDSYMTYIKFYEIKDPEGNFFVIQNLKSMISRPTQFANDIKTPMELMNMNLFDDMLSTEEDLKTVTEICDINGTDVRTYPKIEVEKKVQEDFKKAPSPLKQSFDIASDYKNVPAKAPSPLKQSFDIASDYKNVPIDPSIKKFVENAIEEDNIFKIRTIFYNAAQENKKDTFMYALKLFKNSDDYGGIMGYIAKFPEYVLEMLKYNKTVKKFDIDKWIIPVLTVLSRDRHEKFVEYFPLISSYSKRKLKYNVLANGRFDVQIDSQDT